MNISFLTDGFAACKWFRRVTKDEASALKSVACFGYFSFEVDDGFYYMTHDNDLIPVILHIKGPGRRPVLPSETLNKLKILLSSNKKKSPGFATPLESGTLIAN